MKCYDVVLECGSIAVVCKKTRKDEQPKYCDGCDKRIKKGMWVQDCEADYYCMECSQNP